jgi:hypothetical protein
MCPRNPSFCSGEFAIRGGIDNNLLSRAVIFWHGIASDAQLQDYSHAAPTAPEQPGPCYTSRAMAIVHVAMHDAYVSVTKESETYLAYDHVPTFSREGEPDVRCLVHTSPLAMICFLPCVFYPQGYCCVSFSAVVVVHLLVQMLARERVWACCVVWRVPLEYRAPSWKAECARPPYRRFNPDA